MSKEIISLIVLFLLIFLSGCATIKYELFSDNELLIKAEGNNILIRSKPSCRLDSCQYKYSGKYFEAPDGKIRFNEKEMIVFLQLDCAEEFSLRAFKISKENSKFTVESVGYVENSDTSYGHSTMEHQTKAKIEKNSE